MGTTPNLEQLSRLLEEEMPHAVFERRRDADGPSIVMVSPSEQVGELVVTDDGDELTVCIGGFTHSHWACLDSSVSPEERPCLVARDVLGFITAVLADEVEFYGTGRSGGSRPVGKPRGWISKVLLGRTTYRWSGPVSE